jgi:hypothetical protein
MINMPSLFKGFGLIAMSVSIVASAGIAEAQVFANPNYVVPPSSQNRPQDLGIRARSHYLMYVGTPYRSSGPPDILAMNYGPFAASTAPQGYGPADVRAAYKIPPNAGINAIAVVDAYNDPTALADFNVFASQFGLPQETSTDPLASTNKVFQVVYGAGGTTPPANNQGWSGEISLDIEWAHAIAPNAKIFLVETPTNSYVNLFNGVKVAANLPNVHQVSQSYGGGEFAGQTVYDDSFNHAGVVFFASAGDVGGAQEYPSESPSVVGVGGTSLQVNASGQVLSETAWNGSGGGPSSVYPRPAFQNSISSIVDTSRGCPDVSGVADPYTGVAVYGSYAFGGWAVIGGTSLACPVVAAITNVRGQNAASTLDELVRIYANNGSSLYRDITQGTAGIFSATVGWDFITGIGSPVGLFPPPPGANLTSVTVPLTPVKGGVTTSGLMHLDKAAPAGGVLLTLSSSNTAIATVPASAPVFAGSLAGSFAITTKVVSVNSVVTISATYKGVTKTAVLGVDPVTFGIKTFALSAPSVLGSASDNGSVVLTDKAPVGGSVVTLTSSNKTHVVVPATVTVPATGTTVGFTARTGYVNANLAVTLTASYNGTSKTFTVTLTPIQLTAFSVAPTSVISGAAGKATASLNGKAFGDTNGGSVAVPLGITFTSAPSGLITFPASNLFPLAATYSYFGFTTNGVNASILVTITAKVNNSSKTATITLTPATLSSMHAATATVAGGKTDVITAVLTGKAGAGGKVLILKSSNTAALTVPATATVAQNITQVAFTATALGVNADTAVVITATSGVKSVTTTVTVKAPHALSVALGKPSVQGGTGTFGAAYLDAKAGPAGATVTLASSNTAIATVPVSFKVGAGLTGGTFNIATKAVAGTSTVTISATCGGVTKSIVLTVTH